MKTLFFLSFWLFPMLTQAQSPDQTVKAADAFRIPKGPLRYLVTVKDFDGKEEIRTTKYRVAYLPPEKTKVTTVFPSRSIGRNFLMNGDDLWLQTPDIKRPTRIGFQQRLTGEVANGDISKTNFAVDYNATFVNKEKILGRSAKKLHLTAKSRQVTYEAINYWIEENSHRPIKAEFLTKEGKVLKRGYFKNPKMIMGQLVFTQLELVDGLLANKRSTLDFDGFSIAQFKPGEFNKESLSQNGEDF